jgi:hypothetical protein
MTNNQIETISDTFNLQLSSDFDVKIVDLKITEYMLCYQVTDITNPALLENSNSIFLRVKDAPMSGDYIDLASILSGICNDESYIFYIIVAAIVLLIILLLAIIGIGIFCYCRKKRKLQIIQPEAKTYRETQIIMQIENHGLLKTDL